MATKMSTDNAASCTNSGSGEQNIGQGDGAIGKQENISQAIDGNGNIVAGSAAGGLGIRP